MASEINFILDEVLPQSEVEREEFKINDDVLADWAIQKIKSEVEDTDRLIRTIEDQIAFLEKRKDQLQKQHERKTAFLKQKLLEYFDNVEKRETKTQVVYKLPSGNLILKKQHPKYEKDEEIIIDWLVRNNMDDFIKYKSELDWNGLKNSGVNLEQVDGLEVVHQPDRFEIKV